MEEMNIMELITQTLIIPAVLALCGYLLIIIKSYAQRVTKSIMEKNEIDSLCSINNLRSTAMQQISMVVEAVVGSHMRYADEMKLDNFMKGGKMKLSDGEIDKLQSMAHSEVSRCLPEGITSNDGNVMRVLGGHDCYETLVSNLIEKYVSEFKIKSK